MEAQRQVIRQLVAEGLTVQSALQTARMPRSTYYYKPGKDRPGRKASETTTYNGVCVPNRVVVEHMTGILSPDFIDYGYLKTTKVLNEQGFQIGKAKVYRLMKQERMLHPARKAGHHGKQYVSYTSPQPDGPMKILETDFKYLYIDGEKRFAYLLTILDTFHREVYEWHLSYEMKTNQIINLVIQLLDNHLIRKGKTYKDLAIIIRSDNGSQFIAKKYRQFLLNAQIRSEYIPPATPQMNGHIESFHSIVEKLVCRKYGFSTVDHAREVLARFYKTYNEDRIMRVLDFKSPANFIGLWNSQKIILTKKNGKNHFIFRKEGANPTPPFPEDF